MSDLDQSDLYSGLNSPSYRISAAKRDEKKQEKQLERHQIIPAAVIINELLEKEKKNVIDMTKLIVDGYDDEKDIKAELIARRMTYNFIINFQTSINNLLREPRPIKEKETGDG